LGVSVLLAWQLRNGLLTRVDGIVLLIAFVAVMGWSIRTAIRQGTDPLGGEFEANLNEAEMSLKAGIVWLLIGLVLLIASSRLLVWGAVEIALALGVSDLIVGLTVVAIGTSLPELASSIAATRKGEHDIALGNIIGSNLFNTLAVIGLAGVIHPLAVDRALFYRDLPVMGVLTVFLLLTCLKFKGGKGRITRLEGILLTLTYAGYTTWVVINALQEAAGT
jgi:cation:H+ antiporter